MRDEGYFMEFSLIMGTLNRAKETAICLRSLLKQKFKDFEVIIIDQSTDEETRKLAYGAEFGGLNIIYTHVDFRGLSRARNAGLALASGRYFALIDDDAGYDENYLLMYLLGLVFSISANYVLLNPGVMAKRQ